MTIISEKIANSLIKTGSIPSEEKQLYEYGIRLGILQIINLLTILAIGLIMGMGLESLVFLIACAPVRSYTGGYHASTPLKCYLLSIPLSLAVLLGIRLIPWNAMLSLSALLFAAAVILLLAPVEDLNKPLDQIEKTVYRRRARAILAALSFTAILFWFLEFRQISMGIVMALSLVAILLILGALKNNRNRINAVS